MSLKFDKKEISRRCNEFFELYNVTEGRVYEMCKLKKIHTAAVAKNCEYIAQHMNLSEYDGDIAWIIGELHDFARFGQAVVTETFRDSDKYNHAKLGASLLFKYNLIEDIIPNYAEICAEDKIVMEKAILYHSNFKLPEDLSDREKIFCEIIREADQTDIFRTIVTSGWQNIYGHSKEEILATDISEGIEEAFYKHELADYSKRATFADFHIAHIALGFGLKSDAAKQRVVEQGYLSEMMDIEFQNPKVQEKYLKLKKCVEDFFQIKG